MDTKQHLFIIGPFKSLNLQLDTSLQLAYALSRIGERVFITQVADISAHSQPKLLEVKAQKLSFLATAQQPIIEKKQLMSLLSFSVIYVRKEPPVDLNYQALLWLLDSVSDQVTVLNSPKSLLRYNEKALVLQFANCSVSTLISKDKPKIAHFIAHNCNHDAIIKPLHQYGGKGVQRISTQDIKNIRLNNFIVVQPFLSQVFQGEIRVFGCLGEPIAWCLKKPAQGNFLANTNHGATLKTYVPPLALKKTVANVLSHLHKMGLSLVGLDIIDGLITEINVTSPRLLHAKNDTNKYYFTIAKNILKGLPKSIKSR